MSRAFSEHEKDLLRQTLLKKGSQLFSTYGLKKTSVDELARAAGISKGAFYLFFASKEELFMEIVEGVEAEFRDKLFRYAFQPDHDARQNFKDFLNQALVNWESYPLLRQVDQETFMILLRKLPPERVQAHATGDDNFVTEFMQRWQAEGHNMRLTPRTVSGLMKALFYVSIHRDDFGKDVYPDTMQALIEAITDFLIPVK
jgi:AcrR family transcriptional regulator